MKRIIPFMIALIWITSSVMSAAMAAEIDGYWQSGYYVDEFNDPTDDWFITTTVSGTFSNSATKNSDAKLKLLADFNSFAFELYEYNDHQVTNIFNSTEEYEVAIKDADGNIHQFTAYLYPNDNRIFFYTDFIDDNVIRPDDGKDRAVYNEIIPIFEKEGQIKISITSGVSHYVFTLININFKREFNFNYGLELKAQGLLEEWDYECYEQLASAFKHFYKLTGDSEAEKQISDINKILGIDRTPSYEELTGGYVVGDTIVHKDSGEGVIQKFYDLKLQSVGSQTTYKYVLGADIKWANGEVKTYGFNLLIDGGSIEPKN